MMNNNEVKTNLTIKEKLLHDVNKIKSDFQNPVVRKIRAKKGFVILAKFIRALILVGLTFVILMPLFQKIVFAFRDVADTTNPQVAWITENYSIVNFQIAIELLGYWNSLWNTFWLSTLMMVLQVMMAAVAGYSFARLKFKGNNVIFLLALCTLLIPNESLFLPRTMFFTESGFFGIKIMQSVWGIIFMTLFGAGIRSAIFIYLFRQFFRNIPIELDESAQIDGAGVIRTFWSVMLPNARGAIITVGLFAFVWQWNDYYFADLFRLGDNFPTLSYILGSGGFERLDTTLATLGNSFYEYIGLSKGDSTSSNPIFYNLIANTGALLVMLPLLIGFFFVQKQFVESIERTGIVG